MQDLERRAWPWVGSSSGDEMRKDKELESFIFAFIPPMFLVLHEDIVTYPCPQVNK